MFASSQTSVETSLDPFKGEVNPRTVHGRIRTMWDSQPDKVAIIFYDDDDERTSLTNGQLRDLSERGASLLRQHGVRKGDVVCNMLSNSMEREVVNFAILMAGAVILHGEDIVDIGRHFWEPLERAEVKYIVVDPSNYSPSWKSVERLCKDKEDIVTVSGFQDCSTLRKIFKFRLSYDIKGRPGVSSTFDIIRGHNDNFVERVSSHEPASICVERCNVEKHYRMVLRTHLELCQMAHRIVEMLRCHSDDIILNDIGLSWVPGLPYCYFGCGCTMVKSTLCYCPPSKVVRETWKLIETEQCTMASLEPPMIQLLSSHCEDLPEPKWKLRAITTGGLVRQSIMDAIGPCADSIIVCYSLIEAGLVSRLIVTADSAAKYSEGCVGDLFDPLRTRLVSSQKSSQIGEILLQGKLVCQEYHNDPMLTKASFTHDRFLYTGDLGFISDDTSPTPGQLYVLGRKTDAIIRGNTAIYPWEIEEKVNQCPGIWKVKVVSIKDNNGVVKMCACVIPRSQDAVTIERVKEYCRYQFGGTFDSDTNPHMPSYVFFFNDFPMRQGSVNRRLLGFMASEIVHSNATMDV